MTAVDYVGFQVLLLIRDGGASRYHYVNMSELCMAAWLFLAPSVTGLL